MFSYFILKYFSLCVSIGMISIGLFSSSQILCFDVFKQMLILINKFLISDTVFFMSRISFS